MQIKQGPYPQNTWAVGQMAGEDHRVEKITPGLLIDAELAEDMMLDFTGPSEWIELRPATQAEREEAQQVIHAGQQTAQARADAQRAQERAATEAAGQQAREAEQAFFDWLAAEGIGSEQWKEASWKVQCQVTLIGAPDPYLKRAHWHGENAFHAYQTPGGFQVAYASDIWHTVAFGTPEALADLKAHSTSKPEAAMVTLERY